MFYQNIKSYSVVNINIELQICHTNSNCFTITLNKLKWVTISIAYGNVFAYTEYKAIGKQSKNFKNNQNDF